MKKIITIGELLIDFVNNTKGDFEIKAGGAPANVAVANSKLGGISYFLGQVGNDYFGNYLIDTLNKYKVNTNYVLKTDLAKTSLAFVFLDEKKDRSFLFYRNPGADQLYSKDEFENLDFKDSILHFCSVSLGNYPIKKVHDILINKIIENNGIISFDPNLRFSLFEDKDEYFKIINEYIKFADILKISEDELFFITKLKNYDEGIAKLLKLEKLKYLIITKGENGASLYTKKFVIKTQGIKVDVLDTTGAGDSFIGAFLNKIAQSGIIYDQVILKNYLKFANKAASKTVMKKGVMNSLPDIQEMEEN